MSNDDGLELLSFYRRMLLIREFEQRLDRFFADGRIHGTTHSCTGQEATAVGACAALSASDYVTSNHRGHGHFIAKGGDPKRLMAELFGKATGVSGGRGGSQHVADLSIGFLGSNGITGGGLPIATGAALAIKIQKRDSVVLCFFGDGAANQGTFHESVNMAAIWKLPVIFFCENNLYAMSTPFACNFPIQNVCVRAAGYAMAGEVIDGNDFFAVRDAVSAAAGRVRAGNGPCLIEALTYRHCGHSKSDGCEYRTRDEEAAWRLNDPIANMKRRLLQTAAPAEIEQAEREAAGMIDEAVAFALQSPPPDTAGLEDSIWVS
ncbi:MAG TPA: thiamine pyrophosphate-dependent dehydrogenase E1 component subunit alpha [Planctomycetota bacterium]|nr:thiamine pyrophosphate-dependent dehydrogenase E1 component subunit alpha [Planctomycetota bacterium]